MRRAQMEARIQRNMAQAAKMEEKRKEHFWQKKAHHEALRQEQLELMEREAAAQGPPEHAPGAKVSYDPQCHA